MPFIFNTNDIMMNNKVTVMPNQGMMDVIIMGCGSVEAAEDFCSLNGVAISDVPITGSVYKVLWAAPRLVLLL